MSALFHFDTGLREQTGERRVWHGHGWMNDDGSIRYPVGLDTSMVVDIDGSVRIYHKHERAW